MNKFSDFSLCCLLFCVFALICFDLLLLVLLYNILFILRRRNTRAVLDCICLYSVYRYAAAGSSRVEDKFVVVPIEATTFAMSQCGKKREEEREEATKGGRQ